MGGGRTEFLLVQLLRFLRVEASMFRPGVPIVKAGRSSRPVSDVAVPLPGSVVQADFNRVFDFYTEQLRFLSSQGSNLGHLLGIDSVGTGPDPAELRIALVSRVANSSWEAAYVAHFLGSARHSVVLVTRSSRLKSVLRGPLGFKVVSFPRLTFRKFWDRLRVKRSAVATGIAETDRWDSRPSDEVVVIEHQGPSYAHLYRWSQYDGDRQTPDFSQIGLRRLSYSKIDHRSLNRRQLVICLVRTLLVTPQALAVTSRCPSGLRSSLFFEILRLGFEVRSTREGIRRSYPELRVSLFAYDMLVPPSLSIALSAEGVWRIATLERPNVHLTGLPVLVDDWLVPADEAPQFARLSSSVRFRRLVQVGYWRTDFLFAQDVNRSTEDAEVLVLPYHVDDSESNESGDPFTSAAVFEHFIDSVIQLCGKHPELRFLVRAKNDSWITNPRLNDCVRRMRQVENLLIDATYDVEGRSYHLAKSVRVVIGKYTSMMEEMRSFGKPVVIHNFNQFKSHDFADGDLGLPWQHFAQDQQQFAHLFRDALLKSADPHRPTEFCDGQVRSRISRHIASVLAELRDRDK